MAKSTTTKKVSATDDHNDLLVILQSRFEENMKRHKGLKWSEVEEKLRKSKKKLASLIEMESTGGEPDVIGYDKKRDEFIFVDCSPETPAGRRSICYDPEALEARKEHKPKNSAVGMAAEMGVEILGAAANAQSPRLSALRRRNRAAPGLSRLGADHLR